jgi:hypothetical protein
MRKLCILQEVLKARERLWQRDALVHSHVVIVPPVVGYYLVKFVSVAK